VTTPRRRQVTQTPIIRPTAKVRPPTRRKASPAIRQSGNPAIRQSGNPAIRQSGNPAIRQNAAYSCKNSSLKFKFLIC
jgi:hypothetical protein